METKATIRTAMLARRQAMALNEKKQFEGLIINHIAKLSLFQKASVVSFYMPIRGEVDLLPLWHRYKKTVLFPKVCGNMLAFYPAQDKKDLERGCFGILEPSCTDAYNVCEIDLIIVPGIVFDHVGYRLGYGKGYYDRLINNNPGVTTLGVCFDEFYVERLPVDPWDANVNLVVTQTGVYRTEGEVR
ncbi:MAG: 5-formyltetrahydrofolate cyclo-ligase [Deltaproteobacteria bacterium]|nr:5-formyltetrahydrofolate cyclo-ligase [Deltaproteobacteria bacterium]